MTVEAAYDGDWAAATSSLGCSNVMDDLLRAEDGRSSGLD
jgi:hypothetical protein